MLDNRVLFWALGAAMALLGSITEFRSWASPDVGWYLYAARRVLDGARLYADVVEINPPLVIWLNMPPVLLARALGLADVTSYRICILALLVTALMLCDWLLRRLPDLTTATRRYILLLAVFVLFVLPREDFGQREHLMLALALPYLLLAVVRAEERGVSTSRALLIGLLAGVGLALKPHFALFWIGVEAYVFLARRHPTLLVRPESLAAAGVPVLYGLGVALLMPQYLALVREVGALYSGFLSNSLFVVLVGGRGAMVAIFALLAGIALASRSPHRRIVVVLNTAIAAFLIVAVLQRKGWPYHLYPAFASATMLLGLLTLSARRVVTGMVSAVYSVLAVAIFAGVIGLISLSAARQSAAPRRAEYDPYKGFPTLVREVRRRATGQSVVVLSTNIRAGFPLMNYSGARWASRVPSLWVLGAVYQDSLRNSETVRYHDRAEMGAAERWMLDALVEDLRRERPRLLVVPRTLPGRPRNPLRRLDYLAYFSRDPRFSTLFADYRLAGVVGDYRIYERLLGRPPL